MVQNATFAGHVPKNLGTGKAVPGSPLLSQPASNVLRKLWHSRSRRAS